MNPATMFTILLFLATVLPVSFCIAQNGKIISKTTIDLTTTTAWDRVAEGDSLKPEFSHLDDLDFYAITYQSDSLEVEGMLVVPKANGKYPVVIFNRGGNRTFAPLTIETLVMYTSRLATRGYVIIGSNYRDKDEFGGAELNDVLVLAETIRAVDKADTTRIGMFGWSRGGMMTYLALKESNRIKTAIVGNGPTDLFQTIAERPGLESRVFAQCIPDYWNNKDAELQKRSAAFWPQMLCKESSLLILCSTRDEQVNYRHGVKMAEQLHEIGYDYEFKIFDTDHFFSDRKEELNELVIDWFESELK